MVPASISASMVSPAAYLAATSVKSDNGSVSSNSSVPCRASSAKARMLTSGITSISRMVML